MATDYTFQGWLGHDKSAMEGNLKWETFTPKDFEETDVDIQVTHCGVCATDVSTLRNGWGYTEYPQCVGHEVVGTVVRLGSNVSSVSPLKIGDRVGVGAQCGSCLESSCEECSSGFENHCRNFIGTYAGRHKDGSKSFGGYSDYVRAPGRFVVKIPDSLPGGHAAPMLCAGKALLELAI